MRQNVLRTGLAALVLVASVSQARATSYRVVTADCLWNLAGKFYGDHFKWRRIAAANPQIKDPNWIYPNQVLEIPDEGARPVEASVAIKVEAEKPAAPEPVPAAGADIQPPAPDRKPETLSEKLSDDDVSSEGLSIEIPPSMTSDYVTMRRIKVPAGFKPDAAVIEDADGGEKVATVGDTVPGRLTRPLSVKPGDRFAVYRQAAAMESDKDPKARYLQEIGLVEVKRHVRAQDYLFTVIKAGDPVQAGDWLREAK